jgi:mono/diheme cytochrome c family protein
MPHKPVSGLLVAGVLLAIPPAIAADETRIVLAEGDGRNRVQALCSMCHSVDYIVMNSPFLDAAGWEKSVRKMIEVMGAPISDADAAIIVDYLSTHYGARPAPAAKP